MKKTLAILLGLIVSIFFLIFFVYFLFSRSSEHLVSGSLSTAFLILLVGFITKRKKHFVITFFTTSILALIFLIFLKYGKDQNKKNKTEYKYNNHDIEWKSKIEKTAIPIKFNNHGGILLKGKIDNKNIGYLLFDTGYAITNLSNELDRLSIITPLVNGIRDASGKIKKQKVRMINTFSIGGINMKSFKYNSPDSNLYNFSKDSVIGILGMNAIKHFIWDIDMLHEKVTISSKGDYDYTNYNYETIELIKKYWTYDLLLKVNNSEKRVMLDTGCEAILVLKDSIKTIKNYPYPTNKYLKLKSSFSENKLRIMFGSVSIGNYKLDETLVFDKNKLAMHNLLGIPFFHNFERVILDFKKNKIILINPVKTKNIYGTENMSNIYKLDIQRKKIKN